MRIGSEEIRRKRAYSASASSLFRILVAMLNGDTVRVTACLRGHMDCN